MQAGLHRDLFEEIYEAEIGHEINFEADLDLRI
jgi:hypothetical protein